MAGEIIGNLAIGLGLDTGRFESGFRKARRSQERFHNRTMKQMQALRRSINGVVGAYASFAGIRGFAGAVSDSLEFADKVEKLNRRLGASAEFLQGIAFAAEQSGTEFTVVARAMEFLQDATIEATKGTKAQADAFQALRLDAQAFANLHPDRQILTIAEALRKVDNQSQKINIARDLFGRAGGELIALLDEGEEGIEALIEQFDKLGVTMSTQQVRDAAAARDAMNLLSKSVEGLQNQIAVSLAGPLTSFSNWLTEVIAKSRRGGETLFNLLNPDATRLSPRASFTNEFETGGNNAARVIEEINLALIPAKKKTKALQETVFLGIEGMGLWAEAEKSLNEEITADIQAQTAARQRALDESNAKIVQKHNERKALIEGQQEQFARTLSANMVQAGQSGFDGILELWKQTLSQMIIEAASARLIQALFPQGFNIGGGGVKGFFGSLFGGFFADGGSLPAGKVGVVGERGPELITGPATVTPMDGAGGVTIVQHNNFETGVDPVAIGAMLQRNQEQTIAAIRDMNSRGR